MVCKCGQRMKTIETRSIGTVTIREKYCERCKKMRYTKEDEIPWEEGNRLLREFFNQLYGRKK